MNGTAPALTLAGQQPRNNGVSMNPERTSLLQLDWKDNEGGAT